MLLLLLVMLLRLMVLLLVMLLRLGVVLLRSRSVDRHRAVLVRGVDPAGSGGRLRHHRVLVVLVRRAAQLHRELHLLLGRRPLLLGRLHRQHGRRLLVPGRHRHDVRLLLLDMRGPRRLLHGAAGRCTRLLDGPVVARLVVAGLSRRLSSGGGPLEAGTASGGRLQQQLGPAGSGLTRLAGARHRSAVGAHHLFGVSHQRRRGGGDRLAGQHGRRRPRGGLRSTVGGRPLRGAGEPGTDGHTVRHRRSERKQQQAQLQEAA